MSLLGKAAVAMWWSIRPDQREEFSDWHSHEHFPERMSIAGFRRGSRWTSTTDAEGFFVLYELEQYEVLTSTGYLDRLNAPTPWSRKMMPHHRDMVRSQCRVLESFGALSGGFLATVQLSPKPGQDEEARRSLKELLAGLPSTPGLTGGHLLRTDTPAMAQTSEQRIRGGDAVADWIVVASGYDSTILRKAAEQVSGLSVQEPPTLALFRLAFMATSEDLKVS